MEENREENLRSVLIMLSFKPLDKFCGVRYSTRKIMHTRTRGDCKMAFNCLPEFDLTEEVSDFKVSRHVNGAMKLHKAYLFVQ